MICKHSLSTGHSRSFWLIPTSASAAPRGWLLSRVHLDPSAYTHTSPSTVMPGNLLYLHLLFPDFRACMDFSFSNPGSTHCRWGAPGPPHPMLTSALAIPIGQHKHRVSQEPQSNTNHESSHKPQSPVYTGDDLAQDHFFNFRGRSCSI